MTGKYGKLFQLLSQISNKREFHQRLTLDLALLFPDFLTFQLLFLLPGLSFDYFDLLVNSYLSTGEPTHL